MKASEIRRQAREALRGKWGKSVCITLAYIVIVFIILLITELFESGSVIKTIVQIIQIFINVPLSLGFAYSMIKIKRNEEVRPFDFLKIGFKNFGRAWKLDLRIFLKLIVPIIILIIGLVFIYVALFGATLVVYELSDVELDWNLLSNIFYIGIAIYLLGLILSIIFGLLYSLVFMVAYDNPYMAASVAVNKSAELMRGNRWKFFVLILSFLGWAILGILSLGIGLLWLIPYVQVTGVCFYDELLKINKNNKKEKQN